VPDPSSRLTTREARAWRWLTRRADRRRAGREADAGGEAPGWRLAPLYTAFAATGGVIAQLGQSLDGRIATESGHSHYVNDGAVIDHLHRMRALADAVVVGAGTALADDPALTVRRVAGQNPLRVVIDPRARLPDSLRVFNDGQAPTLHVVGRAADPGGGRETLVLDFDGAGALDRLLAALAERGGRAIFVEGGGTTVSRFLRAGLLDRLHVAVAPVLIGSGVEALRLPAIDRMDQALRAPATSYRLGADTLFDLDLRAAR